MFGRVRISFNKQAKPAASDIYNAVCVYNERGEYETLLLTESDLTKVRARASKNPEDVVQLSWVARCYLWAGRLLRVL